MGSLIYISNKKSQMIIALNILSPSKEISFFDSSAKNTYGQMYRCKSTYGQKYLRTFEPSSKVLREKKWLNVLFRNIFKHKYSEKWPKILFFFSTYIFVNEKRKMANNTLLFVFYDY